MKIGIVGGSFDPIHHGHLIMAEHVRIKKQLDKVIFIPTGNAPHKKYKNSGETRIEMVELAISNNDCFISCDIDIKKPDVTYTVDTMKELKLKYPKCDFYFIIGLDNLFDLETWNGIDRLGNYTKFLVSQRIYENSLEKNAIDKCNELRKKYNLEIEIVDTPIIEISSSDIRKRIQENLSINYLTTEKVIEYIKYNRLYK